MSAEFIAMSMYLVAAGAIIEAAGVKVGETVVIDPALACHYHKCIVD